jgi:hypothetical protein
MGTRIVQIFGLANAVTALFLGFLSPSFAQEKYEAPWDTVLKAHVKPGIKNNIHLNWVDYQKINSDLQYALALREIQGFDLARLDSREKKLVFWINTYNLAAIKLVVENKPVSSIKDLGSIISPVWKKEAIRIQGRPFTLDQIENEKLRPLHEPRIHFAIVCASLSCPDLRAEVYTLKNLDFALNDQGISFLKNQSKGFAFSSSGKKIIISPIFKWFKEDFTTVGGATAFIGSLLKQDLSAYAVDYFDYDWSLNSR